MLELRTLNEPLGVENEVGRELLQSVRRNQDTHTKAHILYRYLQSHNILQLLYNSLYKE